MDMMKTVDGRVHECDESDDVARGVLGRLENMSLSRDYTWVLLAGETQPASQLGVQNGGFWIQLLFGELLCWVDSDPRTWKASKNIGYLAKPSIPEQESSGQTSDSAVDSDIDASLFKSSIMDLDLGVKRPIPQVSKGTSKSVSFAETIQTEVYPFLEASSVSETPIPPYINKEFSSVFSESQANILPVHRSFDCTINLSSFCRTVIRKNLPAYPRRRQSNARMDLPKLS
ncbi:hypothetical protein BASA81_015692 [Batrachochytrium salamandrivorans]|nr:hypothetical protein BASA81_015692 [Batrachochytrium salamandrivorans]